MRVHNAVWHFAETKGNDFARRYAEQRGTLSEADRIKRDNTFLRGRGRIRLRSAWKKMSVGERARFNTDGIMDERKNHGNLSSLKRAATVKSNRIQGNIDTLNSLKNRTVCGVSLQERVVFENSDDLISAETRLLVRHKTAAMEIARANYYEVLCQEQRLRFHTAYNCGSLVGLTESAIDSISSAIIMVKVKDKSRSSEEAFAAVCARVGDVFASVRGAIQFEPDPDYDIPDTDFANARIKNAKSKYEESKAALNALYDAHGFARPDDLRIEGRGSRFFGDL